MLFSFKDGCLLLSPSPKYALPQIRGLVMLKTQILQAAFLLIHGQVLRIFPAKWCLLFCILVFEIGSLICGVSTGVYVLIFGRAFSGVGAAGIFVAILQIVSSSYGRGQRYITDLMPVIVGPSCSSR